MHGMSRRNDMGNTISLAAQLVGEGPLDQAMAPQVKLCCLLNLYAGCEACGLRCCESCHNEQWTSHSGTYDIQDCPRPLHYFCPSTGKLVHQLDWDDWGLIICDKR